MKKLKQNELRKKIEKIVKPIYYLDFTEVTPDEFKKAINKLTALYKQEIGNIFSRLPSKDDPLSREEMLDIIEEQRRKVGLG